MQPNNNKEKLCVSGQCVAAASALCFHPGAGEQRAIRHHGEYAPFVLIESDLVKSRFTHVQHVQQTVLILILREFSEFLATVSGGYENDHDIAYNTSFSTLV